MTLHTRLRANAQALPIFNPEQRAAIRDDLTIALDIIESGDGPVDAIGLRHLVLALRAALRPAHTHPLMRSKE